MDFLVVPSKSPFLLGLDPHLLDIIHLLLLLRDIVLSLLLELCLLYLNFVAWPDFCLIKHFYCNVHALQHCISDPCVPLRHSLFICINLNLLLPCVQIQSDYSAPNKMLSQLLFSDILGQT